MAVLSSEAIKARLKLRIENPKSLVISPLLCPEEAFDIDSLDLRLGSYFLVPRVPALPFYSPDSQSSFSFHRRVHVPLGDFLVVPAHQTVLGATLEFIKLPFDVAGEILTKSSVARTFTVIETAPWVHPNYRGCLTLEIANASNTPMLLYPGRRIGQLVLIEVKTTKRRAGDRELNRTYFGPVFPEPPEFKDPKDDLERIGIRKVRIMRRPEWIGPALTGFCVNGHYAPAVIPTSQFDKKQRFCERCGATTINACPGCKVPFQEVSHRALRGASGTDCTPPSHCSECGSALPWTAFRQRAAADLVNLQENLSEVEKELLKNSLNDLIRDTPQTALAIQGLRILCAKVGTDAIEHFRSILAPILSDAAKESLFPQAATELPRQDPIP
jgi:dCTP deaminase